MCVCVSVCLFDLLKKDLVTNYILLQFSWQFWLNTFWAIFHGQLNKNHNPCIKTEILHYKVNTVKSHIIQKPNCASGGFCFVCVGVHECVFGCKSILWQCVCFHRSSVLFWLRSWLWIAQCQICEVLRNWMPKIMLQYYVLIYLLISCLILHKTWNMFYYALSLWKPQLRRTKNFLLKDDRSWLSHMKHMQYYKKFLIERWSVLVITHETHAIL